MKSFRISLLLFFACTIPALGARAETIPPQKLIEEVAYNEVRDREVRSCWIYHVERTVDGEGRSAEQVESADGPVFRLLTIAGKPLTAEQSRQEDARLARLLSDPAQQRKAAQVHEQDEERLERLTALLPKAFLYQYLGQEGDRISLSFAPNPDFNPPSFEARAFADLAGTMLIDAGQKRLIRLQGKLIHPVDFGFGLLGRIASGGTFEIERTQVSSTHWKTSRVSVHVSGRIILFKSISKQQDEKRSSFRPLPEGTSLQQAEVLLSQAARQGSS